MINKQRKQGKNTPPTPSYTQNKPQEHPSDKAYNCMLDAPLAQRVRRIGLQEKLDVCSLTRKVMTDYVNKAERQ